jgi:hypothetical protein
MSLGDVVLLEPQRLAADSERRRLEILRHIANLPDDALLTGEEVAASELPRPDLPEGAQCPTHTNKEHERAPKGST